jgi:hypothetical protein
MLLLCGISIWSLFSGEAVNPLMLLVSAGCGVGAVVLAGQLLRSRTAFYPDRVEKRDLFTEASMQRADIAGYRMITGRNRTTAVQFVSRRDGDKPLKVYLYGDSGEFKGWRGDMPDLDQVDKAAATAQLMANPDLGATPDERAARLVLLKRIAGGFLAVSIAIAIWVWFWPVPYALAVCAALALPLVALGLVWWSKGALVLTATAAEPRPSVGIGLGCGAVLALQAMEIGTDNWQVAAMLGLAVAVALGGVVYALQTRWKVVGAKAWPLLLFPLAYGWGAVMTIDKAADLAPPKRYVVTVEKMWVSHGKSTSWHVTVSPWGEHRAPDDMTVSHDLYAQLNTDGAACVDLHPGGLGIAWYELHACPASPAGARAVSMIAALPSGDDMSRLYPTDAARQNIEGHTRFTCTITDDGHLSNCTVLAEDPPGVGFGSATLLLAQMFRMKAIMPDGSPSVGKTYTSAIRWQMPR